MRKSPTRSAAWIALAYAALAGIWILAVHFALSTLMSDPRNYDRYDLPTDIALAGITGLLLLILLRRELAGREKANEALRRSQEELELRVRQRTDALDSERRLLKAIIENAPASIALFDGAELCVKWTNREYHQSLPQPLRDVEVVGLSLATLFPDAPSNGMLDIFYRVASTRQPYFDPELAYWETDRGPTYWQWSLVPLPVDAQDVPDLMLLAHDTTEQVLARKRLEEMGIEAKRRAEELRQAQIELEARARELTMLLDISHDLGSTLLLRPLLELILDHSKTLIDYTGATIIQAQGDNLTVVAYRGPRPQEEMVGARVSLDQAPAFREVLRQRAPVILDDLQGAALLARQIADTAGQEVLRSLGASRSWLGVPLMIKDRMTGLLRLDHLSPHYFTPHHAQLALAIANQAAIALENARLYEEAGKVAVLEERQRMARELHDSVSQALYGIALGTHAAREQVERAPEKLKDTLDYILSLSDMAVTEMRALVFELRPEALAQEGLIANLKRLAEALDIRHGVTTQLDLGPEPALAQDVKEALYRVAQEALWNVAKHAQAMTARLGLYLDGQWLVLEVEDDGVGFDADGRYPGHFGLQTMRERIFQLGGRLTIDSAPSRGTCVRAQIPCAPLA